MKMPALQFYPADWRKDPGVQSLNYHDRGIWFEMLCLMHESQERGVLLLNGHPMPEEAIARNLGVDSQTFNQTLSTLLTYGVARRRESDGAIYNKRMVEDEIRIQEARETGHSGGNPKLCEEYNKPGFLYAIQRDSDGATKIGIAINPVNRLAKLRYQNKPAKLEMVACMQVDDMGVAEADAHQFFKEKQVMGEWFALTDVDLESIGFTLKGKNKGKDKGEQTTSTSSSSSSSIFKEEEEGKSAPAARQKKSKPTAPLITFNFDIHDFEGVTSSQIDAWKKAYPLIDVEQEIMKAAVWVDANDKMPRAKGYKIFINGWLSRSNERAATAPRSKPSNITPIGGRHVQSNRDEERSRIAAELTGRDRNGNRPGFAFESAISDDIVFDVEPTTVAG